MTHIRKTVFALLATAFTFAFSSAAFAQTTVLVIDKERIYTESQAGQSIASQVQTIMAQMDAEVDAASAPLESEAQALNNDLQGLSMQDLQSRPDLQQRVVALKKKNDAQVTEINVKANELVKTQAVATRKIDEQLYPILEAIVAERGADIIIERNALIYAGPSVDITDDVISRLNAVLPSVTVTRQYIERKPQQ